MTLDRIAARLNMGATGDARAVSAAGVKMCSEKADRKSMRTCQMIFAALMFVVLFVHDGKAAAPQYQVIDLSVKGGISSASDINNSRQIAGAMSVEEWVWAFPRPILMRNNRAVRTGDAILNRVVDNLGLPSSFGQTGGNSFARRINNSGQVLAWAISRAYLVAPTGTLSSSDTTDLGTAGGDQNHAQGMNDLGQVVGEVIFSGSQPWHAYLYTPGSPLKDLGTLGGLYSAAWGINNLGQITGYAENAARFPRAFRTAPNAVITPADDLGSLGGKYSHGRAINDAGVVAGLSSIADESASHLFRTRPNARINPATDDLGTLPGGNYIEPLDINASGDLVGWGFSTGFSQHAFVVLGSTLYDLNDLIDPSLGITLQVAGGINDWGDIVATGTIAGSNSSRAFLLTLKPPLSISHTGNQVIVSWSPGIIGWTLQTNNGLATGTWGDYAGTVNNNRATNTPLGANLFFRLKR